MYSVHFRREREVKKNNLVSKMVLGMKKKRKKYLLFKGEDDAKVIQGTLYIILLPVKICFFYVNSWIQS